MLLDVRNLRMFSGDQAGNLSEERKLDRPLADPGVSLTGSRPRLVAVTSVGEDSEVYFLLLPPLAASRLVL